MFYYGDFYRRNGVSCRATLEIVDAYVPEEHLNALLCSQPEMVVVLMNPGGSHPIEPIENAARTPDAIGARSNLVATCPDETQLAIAKVMRCKEFRHARVLNLSDVRERDSKTFLRKLKEGRLPPGDSIFCSQRAGEMQQRLKSSSDIVVCAWGKYGRLRSRSTRALAKMEAAGLRPLGWGDAPMFMHPSRRRKQWPRWIIEHWPHEDHQA